MPSQVLTGGPFTLPPLPYPETALAPAISARTVEFHYHKHHAGYVEKLNELVAGKDVAQLTIEDLIKRTAGDLKATAIFHNAAQVWNHTFYWNSLTPTPEAPSVELRAKINQDFGGLKELELALQKSAESHFASGWSWLVVKNGKLAVMDTPDADTPLAKNITCLLAIDVWEHAYYLDYQNLRKKYLTALISSRLNWKWASTCYTQRPR